MKVRVIILTSIFLLSSIYVPSLSKNVTDTANAYQDSNGGYFSTNADWDNGTKENVTTSTDRYNQTAGTLELDFPYAKKDANLSAYYRFDTEADKLLDETQANNATSTNASFTQNGKFGGTLDYNGSSDATLTNFGFVSGNHSRTISAWIYPENLGGSNDRRTIIWYGTELPGDRFRFQVIGTELGVDIDADEVRGGNVTNNTWHFVSVTFNGTTNDLGDSIFYIDGVQQTTYRPIGASVLDFDTGTTNKVVIGAHTSKTFFWEGKIDELKFYDRNLSANEINEQYNAGKQYRSEGSWTTPIINGTSGKAINSITINVTFGDANNYIDRVSILNSTNATISTANVSIRSNTTLRFSDFDNSLEISEANDTYIKVHLVGNNSATPTLTNISYVMRNVARNRAFVTSYYATEGTIEGFINSTRYDDNAFGYINESQTNYKMGYGTDKEWGYFSEDGANTTQQYASWNVGGHYNVTWGGQANRSGLYAVIQTAEMSPYITIDYYYDNAYRMRYGINGTAYHEYSIVPDESYTFPQFTALTIHNFSAVSPETIETGYLTTNSAYDVVVRNKRVILIPLSGQNNTDYYFTGPNNLSATTSWQNASTLTINQTNADDEWLIFGSADIQMGSQSNTEARSSETRMNIDGGNYSYASMESEPRNDLSHFDWEDYFYVNLTKGLSIGNHTIGLEGKEAVNNSANVSNSRILALKINSHTPQINNSYDYSLQSNAVSGDYTAGDNPMVAHSVVSDFSTQYPFLTLANSIYYSSNYSTGMAIQNQGTHWGENYPNITGYERDGMSDQTDRMLYASFKHHDLNTSTEYFFNTTEAPRSDGGTAYQSEGRVMSLAMATPKYQLNATINITGINKTKGYNYTFKTSYVLTADETTPTMAIYNFTSGAWEDMSFNPTKDGVEHDFAYSMNDDNVNSTGATKIRYTIAEHEGGQTDLALDYVWVDYEIDTTPPAITNTTATPNPQDYGFGVNISANITDLNGVSSVFLNISLPDNTWENDSMTSGAINTYYNYSIYETAGMYNYTIWAKDSKDNFNSSSGNFTIDQNYPPYISNETVIPNPQEYSKAVNISANITDLNGVSSAHLNITYPGGGTTNTSMNNTGSLYWVNSTLYNAIGTYNFTIWASDTYGIYGDASGNFTIQDTTPPTIQAVEDTPDPQEAGSFVNVSAHINDGGGVNNTIANLNISFPDFSYSNITMNKAGEVYYINQSYILTGTYNYTIWAKDSKDNFISSSGNFTIQDTTPPAITNATATPPSTEQNGTVNITATITDASTVTAHINITYPGGGTTNTSMNNEGDVFYKANAYSELGNYYFTIWANDSRGNTANATGTFTITETQASNTTTIKNRTSTSYAVSFSISEIEKGIIYVEYQEKPMIKAKEIRWDFGDGQGAKGKEAYHDYGKHNEGQTYNITMEVITEQGESRTATKKIQIGEPTAEPTKGEIEIFGVILFYKDLIISGLFSIFLIGLGYIEPKFGRRMNRIIESRTRIIIALGTLLLGLYLGGYLNEWGLI